MINILYKHRLTVIDRLRKEYLNRMWYTKKIGNCRKL